MTTSPHRFGPRASRVALVLLLTGITACARPGPTAFDGSAAAYVDAGALPREDEAQPPPGTSVAVYQPANRPPSAPVITRTPNTNTVPPGTTVGITAAATDPDGDAVTYVWDGRPSEQAVYPLGRHVVKVRAVDTRGAESPWSAIVFFVADDANGGGMVLTGPSSTIREEGIQDATITEYTFTVPPVAGHSGDDHGLVRGFDVATGTWEQLGREETENGVRMSGKLPPGKYSKLEFYYYTNHKCMYDKSNITYTARYHFQ